MFDVFVGFDRLRRFLDAFGVLSEVNVLDSVDEGGDTGAGGS